MMQGVVHLLSSKKVICKRVDNRHCNPQPELYTICVLLPYRNLPWFVTDDCSSHVKPIQAWQKHAHADCVVHQLPSSQTDTITITGVGGGADEKSCNYLDTMRDS